MVSYACVYFPKVLCQGDLLKRWIGVSVLSKDLSLDSVSARHDTRADLAFCRSVDASNETKGVEADKNMESREDCLLCLGLVGRVGCMPAFVLVGTMETLCE